MQVDLGVKTKTQLLAERTVFKQLLIAVIAASAEPELSDPDDEFVPNLCRHFAMLFTVEPPNPPGGRGGSRDAGPTHPPGGKRGKNEAPAQSAVQSIMAAANLKELDPLLFLDALVAVLADDNREQAKVRVPRF
jgi:transformation/transcription domain-associated protein